MATIAYIALGWIDNNSEDTAGCAQAVDNVPAEQWDSGHWVELSEHCRHRHEMGTPRRPVNGLCIEVGQPPARCLMRPPDGRGITRDGSNLSWLLSGGDAVAYGECCRSGCWQARKGAEEDHG